MNLEWGGGLPLLCRLFPSPSQWRSQKLCVGADPSAEGAKWCGVWGVVSLPSRLGGLGSVVSSPSGARCRAPAAGCKRIFCISRPQIASRRKTIVILVKFNSHKQLIQQ